MTLTTRHSLLDTDSVSNSYTYDIATFVERLVSQSLPRQSTILLEITMKMLFVICCFLLVGCATTGITENQLDDGTQFCPHCGGAGVITQERVCPRCKGEREIPSLGGLVPCDICGGFGTAQVVRGKCTVCKGSGIVEHPESADTSKHIKKE